MKLEFGKHLCVKGELLWFFTRPFSRDDTIKKFKRLAEDIIDDNVQNEIIETVQHLENEKNMTHLVNLLSNKSVPS